VHQGRDRIWKIKKNKEFFRCYPVIEKIYWLWKRGWKIWLPRDICYKNSDGMELCL
jgi:hypothetical protein